VSGRQARTVAAAVPVMLVNGVAFTGQLAFLRAHLPWPLAGQLMMAAALESVAIYLAFHAHLAALARDSALRLKLASYGFAIVIAALNYSHYSGSGWRPTFAAVAVALMSASSPWLWGVHSRRASRDQMIAAGLIEGRAVRLGATRWLWHPLRSARVMWHATWAGTTDPQHAIAEWTASRAWRGHLSGNRPADMSPAVLQTGAPAGLQTGSPTGTEAIPQTGPAAVTRPVREALPGPVSGDSSKPVRAAANRSARRTANRSATRATNRDAEQEFAAEIAAGQVPTIYQIRNRLHVGNERAKVLRQHIARQAFTT
jgi:hypothetical protein